MFKKSAKSQTARDHLARPVLVGRCCRVMSWYVRHAQLGCLAASQLASPAAPVIGRQATGDASPAFSRTNWAVVGFITGGKRGRRDVTFISWQLLDPDNCHEESKVSEAL